MKKYFNKYCYFYLIYLIINLICIGLLIYYYKSIKISKYLIQALNIDIIQFSLIFSALFILIVFSVILLTFLIISIIQNNKGVNKSIKRGIWILPIVFVVVFVTSIEFSMSASFIFNESKNLEEDELCSAFRFEELENEGIEIIKDYSYQKNNFGKLVNLEQEAIIPESRDEKGKWLNGNNLSFMCIYRQSNYKFIYNKFLKLSNDDFEKNEIKKDGYTLYFQIEEDYISYSLVIENETEYFVASFFAYGQNGLADYSKEQFVSDSLSNYEKWSNY